jgi:hypothetical protein
MGRPDNIPGYGDGDVTGFGRASPLETFNVPGDALPSMTSRKDALENETAVAYMRAKGALIDCIGGHVVHSPTYQSREQSPIDLDGMDWRDNGGFVESLTPLFRYQSPFDFQLAQEPHMQDNTNHEMRYMRATSPLMDRNGGYVLHSQTLHSQAAPAFGSTPPRQASPGVLSPAGGLSLPGVAGPSSRESGSPSRGEGGSSLSIAKARADGKAPAAAASAGGTSTSYLCR